MNKTTTDDLDILQGIEIPIHLQRLTPIIVAVKKLFNAEKMRTEAVTELEHLLNIELPKVQTDKLKKLVKKQLKVKISPSVKEKIKKDAKKAEARPNRSSDAWERYAADPRRQSEVLAFIRSSSWATNTSIANATELSPEGVGRIIGVLKKEGRVKATIKTGNPDHKGAAKLRKFTYWTAV
jgi:hypothetical protein